MVSSRTTKPRTVRFFEIVDHKKATPLPHALPWDGAIAALTHSDVTVAQRTVEISGEDHHGGGWIPPRGLPHMLLLSKIRQGFDVPEVFDRKDGTLEALQLAESEGVAETTHLAFFPRNIVGMIRSQSSPGAANLGQWINSMDLFDVDGHVDVIPLSRVTVQGQMADVDHATGVKIRARTSAAGALRQGGAVRLADAVDLLNQQFGPVTVEMRIYVTRDQGPIDVKNTILEEAQSLVRLTEDGEPVEGLENAELSYISLEREKVAELNMMKDKLAERVEVDVLDDEGRATIRESAARAMLGAYNHLQDDLHAALGQGR